MRSYRTPEDFRKALEQRLLDKAEGAQQELVRLRRYVAFERLLERLFRITPRRWALKGALALEYRFGLAGRPTQDVDLQRLIDAETAEEDFRAAADLDLKDDFYFTDLRRVRNPTETTLRFQAKTELAGREFAPIRVDIGLDSAPDQPFQEIHLSSLLEFCGHPKLTINLTTLEYHVAEKIHAYVQVRSTGENTRVKDLVDLQLILRREEPLDRSALKEALTSTFGAADPSVAKRLPLPPRTWEQTYARLASDLELQTDLWQGHEEVAEWLRNILD